MQPEPLEFWPAANDDYWLRHIIEGSQTRKTEPQLRIQYLINKFEIVDREWKAEMSGRILSKAHDIREKAEKAALLLNNPGIRFRHVAYVLVEEVKKIPSFDVFVEPLDDDDAHANIVITTLTMAPVLSGTVQKLSVEHVKDLVPLFKICDESDISVLETLRK